MASGVTMRDWIWCVESCRSHQMRLSSSPGQASDGFWRLRIASCGSPVNVSLAVRPARSSRPRGPWSRWAQAAPPMTWRWRWWACRVPGSWPGTSARLRARQSPPHSSPRAGADGPAHAGELAARPIRARLRSRALRGGDSPQRAPAPHCVCSPGRRVPGAASRRGGAGDARRVRDPLDSPSRPQHPRAR